MTDSAASATAWTTGTKTYNGALGVDIKGNPQKTILELAKEQGFATGDVTTSEIQDATPAALFSHITERDCYGPEETAKDCADGGAGEGRPGIGHRAAAGRRGRTSPWAAAPRRSPRPRRAATTRARRSRFRPRSAASRSSAPQSELNAVTKADQDAPVLGLFADGNMPVRWTGPAAVRQGYLQPAAKCTDNPERGAEVPKLADMTQKAIDLLSGSEKGKDKGFFLQVEGASIDKRDHAADPCGQIGETVDFDEAVQQALEFARRRTATPW